jgi:hypothetical protein
LQLLVLTQRGGGDCSGWACLAVVKGDLSSERTVRAAGSVVHPGAFSAIGGDRVIVFPAEGRQHALDLWRLDPVGQDWSAPVPLTSNSPYAYNSEPALSPDNRVVAFDCGDQPYEGPGTAVCEVGLDGTGLHVVLAPGGAPPELAAAHTVNHSTFGPDGSLFFDADRDSTQVWRLGPGESTPTVVGDVFKNDNLPCALPDGSIASMWYGETGNQLKVMLPPDHSFVLPPTVEIAASEIGCSA